MARSTQTIFDSLLQEKQQMKALDVLSSTSATAIWRLLLYVVAYCVHVLEVLWDQYKIKVDAEIDAMLPHRAKWYRDKVLLFMKDKVLIQDTDKYDTTGMDEESINAARVVKHAAVSEAADTSRLTIKVAGETNGKRAPIASAEEVQLQAYLQEIKDAGVLFTLVNMAPDFFKCEVDIYYNPMKDPNTVQYDCEQAIKDYIENLPFNGEFSNMALVDTLQAIDGVRIAELKNSESASSANGTYSAIDAHAVPVAGYMEAKQLLLNMKPHTL